MKQLNQSTGQEVANRQNSIECSVDIVNRAREQKKWRVSPRAIKGFTLMELMITVAIVAILAGLAYPSYMSYVRRTHRTDAKAALLQMATGEEKNYLTANTYTTVVATVLPTSASSTYYNFTVPSADANGFTVKATAANGQLADTDCKTLSLTSTGVKSATKSDTTANDAACWR